MTPNTVPLSQPTPEPVENTVPLNTLNPPLRLTPELAEERAIKSEPALSSAGIQMRHDETVRAYMEGREEELRDRAANEIAYKKAILREQAIQQVAKEQGPLSPAQAKHVLDTVNSLADTTDRYSVFEEYYSLDFLRNLERTGDLHSTELTEIKKHVPEQYQQAKAVANDAIVKREIGVTALKNAMEIAEQQSWPGWIVDRLKELVTVGLYTEVQTRGQVPGVSRFYGFRGTNLKAQVDELYAMPLPQFKEVFFRIYKDLTESNPALAVNFLSEVVGRSEFHERLENTFSVLDLSILGSIPKVGLSAARVGANVVLAKRATEMLKDMAKAASADDITGVTAKTAAGDVAEAAVDRASVLVANISRTTDPTKEAVNKLPTLLRQDQEGIEKSIGNFSTPLRNRLVDAYRNTIGGAQDALSDTVRVDRMAGLFQIKEFMKVLKEDLISRNPGLDNAILDLGNPVRNKATNTYDVPMYIGKPGGELFFDAKTAHNYAKAHGLSEYTVDPRQTGPGHVITVWRPMPPETEPWVRNFLAKAANINAPKSKVDDFLNGILNFARSPEDTLTLEHRMQRHAATYGTANVMKLFKEQAKYIQDLARGKIGRDPITDEPLKGGWKLSWPERKKRMNEWNQVIHAARKLTDDEGREGKFFKDPTDLADFYQRHLGRLPDTVEIEAYFAFRRGMELDRMFRDMSILTRDLRLGGEKVTFFTKNSHGKRVESPHFNGVVMNRMPGGEDNMLVALGRLGRERIVRVNEPGRSGISKRTYDEWERDVEAGKLYVLKVIDPEKRPFKGFGRVGDENIRYVLTNSITRNPLDWQQVPRRGGGHFEYDYDWYIKQANVKQEYIGGKWNSRYEGDTTIMAIAIRALGKDAAEHLDKVRILLKDDNIQGAKDFHAQSKIPIEWDKLHGWFKDKRGPGGTIIPARLSLVEPITLVARGKNILDEGGELANMELRYKDKGFRNGLKEGSDARQTPVKFTDERDAEDLLTINNKGTKYNPLYEIEPAKLVDAIPSLDRAASDVVNSLFLNDYKLYSIERWTAKAATLMKHPEQVVDAPMWFFHTPDWKPTSNINAVNKLMAERMKIMQLVGMPSKIDTWLHSTTANLVDMVYEAGFSAKFVPGWLLPTVRNPWTFVRSAVMHANLGIFAIPQLLVQAQTFANIYAIAGARYANAGTYGAYLTMLSRINRHPDTLKLLDERASSAGWGIPGVSKWKPGELMESIREMDNAGFSTVAGEYALHDVLLSPRLVSSATKQFFDAGLMFFRGGEKSVRWGAWHTAYREFRDKFPTKTINNEIRQQILTRADFLTANMSRASSSVLHSGPFSIPAQFLTYQLRVAEQFFGKRFAENTADRNRIRARMMAYYSALYGVPTSFGVTAIPFGDFFRKAALENGYVVGDHWLETAVMDGIPSLLFGIATGGGDYQKGTYLNFGDRLGIKGLDLIKEIVKADEPFLNLMTGAAGSKVTDILETVSPFGKWALGMMRGEGQQYPLTFDDFSRIITVVSAGNNLHRTVLALKAGDIYSKKGLKLETNVSTPLALFMMLTGTQKQSIVDMNTLAWSRKDIVEVQKKALEHAVDQFRKGLQIENNPAEAERYFQRAFTTLELVDFPAEKFGTMLSRAARGNEALVDTMLYNYYIKGSGSKNRDRNIDTYIRHQQKRQP